jgi:hypothetical protein
MRIQKVLALLLAMLVLVGCAQMPVEQEIESEYEGYIDVMPLVVEEVEIQALDAEIVALTETVPAPTPALPEAVASGTKTKKVSKAVIDYSNTQDGYVMVQFTGTTKTRIKAQVKGPTTTYTYNVTPGVWEVFPISDGNGKYQVSVFENVSGTKYAAVTSVAMDVTLKDEFAPFLLANQYVNYKLDSKTVAKAKELVKPEMKVLEKVGAVYNFVVGNLVYDTQKAATVKSGYLPVVDTVLAEKKGICFDYAALMTSMLRSQGVPCKLVVGYAGTAYHAWISVWSAETGWVDGAIMFDGKTWQRMDPTFASSGKKSESIMKYIGDGKNYTVKYLY